MEGKALYLCTTASASHGIRFTPEKGMWSWVRGSLQPRENLGEVQELSAMGKEVGLGLPILRKTGQNNTGDYIRSLRCLFYFFVQV